MPDPHCLLYRGIWTVDKILIRTMPPAAAAAPRMLLALLLFLILQVMGVTSDEGVARQMLKTGGQFEFRAELRSFLRRCLDGNYAGATFRTCVYQEDDLGEKIVGRRTMKP